MEKKKYEYIGDLSQLFEVDTYKLIGGKKDGVKATRVMNEKGLQYVVVADRCMDIAKLSYKGINISYVNQCGVVSPYYYNPQGTNWLKSFTAGMFTTCGLNNVGNPCEDGESLGLHGNIGNTPADEYNVQTKYEEKGNSVVISGIMKTGSLFGSKLWLKRTIQSFQENNQIIIDDEIINNGFVEEEYMQLYHFNIGYPFLSPDCKIQIPSKKVTAANDFSDQYIDTWDKIQEPNMLNEMCYFHELEEGTDGYKTVRIFNEKLGFGLSLSIEDSDLDKFVQWKNLNKGQYVLGFEPATNYIGGKSSEREAGRLKTIPPQSSVRHKLVIEIYES